MKEEFRPTGYPDYEVSNTGVVRRTSTKKVLRCSLSKGYYRAHFRGKDANGEKFSAHRYVQVLVLEAFVGPAEKGQEARHLDGVRTNNNLGNLAWGTPKENSQDKYLHGTMVCGERSPHALLTEKDVISIRQRAANGEATETIAADYPLHIGALRAVINGNRWNHTPGGFHRASGPSKGFGVGKRRKPALDEAKVIKMRERAASGESTLNIATDFGLSEAYARGVINGSKWPHVPGALVKRTNGKVTGVRD